MCSASGSRILVVDDEPAVAEFLGRLLEAEGFSRPTLESDPLRALNRVQYEAWDLVLLDMKMPRVHGLEILKALKERQPGADCVVFSSESDVSLAVSAMQLGAADYVVKGSLDGRELMGKLCLIRERRQQRELDPFGALERPQAFSRFLTRSPRMGAVFGYLERVAPTGLTVIISGPSGTGKELVASAIHELSGRAGPFVGVNAAAIPGQLFASQLFGHVAGAFSGADRSQAGFFEAAAGGTLFLDEIGELPLEAQVQLLRVIEEREYYRVGSTKLRPVQARLVVATNRDLREEIENGRFRMDLYHRLRASAVSLPPLRERREDIELLARSFLVEICEQLVRAPLELGEAVLGVLTRQAWPGNARELRNVLTEAALTERTDELKLSSLPPDYRAGASASSSELKSLVQLEQRHIVRVLDFTEQNYSKAARILGISRATLYRKLKKAGDA